MRYILIYILSIVFFIPAITQIEFEELEKSHLLKNNIVSKTQWDYKYVDGVPVENGFKSAYRKYDKAGNMVIIINYKFTGEVSSVEHYEYNNKGDRTQYIRYKGNMAEMQYKENIEYDSKGNKVKVYGTRHKAPPFKTLYTYTPDNKISEIVYYIGEAVDEKRVFTHEGNTAHIEVLDGEGNQKYRLVNKYNSMGKVIEESKYEPNDAISDKASYQYDSKGNMLKEEKYQYGQFRYRTKYTYDGKGNLLKIVQDESDGTSFVKNQYTFDSNGKLTEEKWRKKPNASFSSKKYYYNSNGLCNKMDVYFASYKLKVLSKFSYKTNE